MRLKAGDSVTIMREANHSLSIIPYSVRNPPPAETVSFVTNEDRENTIRAESHINVPQRV